MITREVAVPVGTQLWQLVCDACGARFALLMDDDEANPHPRFCPFCCHRAAAYRKDQAA